MRNLLESRIGKEIEIQCEGAAVRGKVTKIEGNILHLEKDDVISFVNIEKIVVVTDSREKKAQTPGFLPKSK